MQKRNFKFWKGLDNWLKERDWLNLGVSGSGKDALEKRWLCWDLTPIVPHGPTPPTLTIPTTEPSLESECFI